MEFEWDPVKAARNLVKHGVPFEAAAEFDFDSAMFRSDRRFAYGEDREVARGRIGDRLYTLVFTRRNGRIRIISLRRANRSEMQKYLRWMERNGV